jgi:ATP-dependent DNA helicase RecG
LPEISGAVFEELLVNALIHRDYLISAPIRLFIFDNRIEIISPGHLPNNLTVDKIRAGNSNIRNPILVSYAAKGLLPYHGLGSGIKRALSEWPHIDFTDDREGCLFTATVHRYPTEELRFLSSSTGNLIDSQIASGKRLENVGKEIKRREKTGIASGKSRDSVGKEAAKRRERDNSTSGKILEICRKRSSVTIRELAGLIGVTERSIQRNMQKLQASQHLKRCGGRKTGYWEVV